MMRILRASRLLLAAVLMAGLPVSAQVQIGENVSMNLAGDLGFGYSGDYGDILSSHGLAGNLNADLSGAYYSPQFLSFHVHPYFNQSREASNADSITSASGFVASTGIFSGSHFPGWINYSRTYNSSSIFSVPGVGNFYNHGNSNSFGIGWSELIPDMPTLSIAYQQSGADFETFGAAGTSQNRTRTFNMTSTYRIDGFALNGNYHRGTGHGDLPGLFADQLRQTSDSSNSSYSFGASHPLPLNGSASAHYSSDYYDFSAGTGTNSGNIKTADGAVSFAPMNKLTVDGNVLYTDNLVGTLYQTVLASGGTIQTTNAGFSSSSLGLSGDAVYALTPQMRVVGRADHREQVLGDNAYSADSYSGVFSYFRMLFGGKASFSQTASRNTISVLNQDTLGLSTAASYARSIGAWNLGGSFLLNQNQATALVTYQSNSYVYSGTVGRPIGRMYWSGSATRSKSTLGGQQGSDINSQSYTTALSLRKIGISAGYSKSSGNAIQTPTGLVNSPLPLAVLPTSFLLYGGESYSFGVGGSPIRGLSFTGSFVNTLSNTMDAGINSRNNAQLANFYLQYRFRKMNFSGGYTRVLQGFTLTGSRDQLVSTYYFGISRWFNLF